MNMRYTIIINVIIFWPTSTKLQALKLDYAKTTTMTGYHMASNVARKATASPFEEQYISAGIGTLFLLCPP